MLNTLADLISDRLDEMAAHDCNEQHVDGLRAHLDILLATSADLTAFADELDITVPALAAVA